jgi:hypothetical protein
MNLFIRVSQAGEQQSTMATNTAAKVFSELKL